MGIRIDGLDKFKKKLDDTARAAKEVEGPHQVTLGELMTPAFVAGCSKFAAFAELVAASGCKAETAEDLATVEWNKFIASNTRFGTWEAMWHEAGAEWMAAKFREAIRPKG